MATATFELGNVQVDKLTEPAGGPTSSFGDTVTAPGLDAPASSALLIGTINATGMTIGHTGITVNHNAATSIFTNGNVGINTPSPSANYALDIAGTASGAAVRIAVANTGDFTEGLGTYAASLPTGRHIINRIGVAANTGQAGEMSYYYAGANNASNHLAISHYATGEIAHFMQNGDIALGGTITPGTTTTNAKLIIFNNARASQFNSGGLNVGGTSTDMPLMIDSTDANGNSARIGTNLPVYIKPNWPSIGLNTYWNGTAFALGAGSSSNWGGWITVEQGVGTNAGHMDFFVSSTSGNTNGTPSFNNSLSLAPNGDVNIGSSSAGTGVATLFVKANGTVGIGAASAGSALYVQGSSASSSYISVVDTTGNNNAILGSADSPSAYGFVGNLSNNPFIFRVNNAEVGRFDTSGHFGIGSTFAGWQPGYQLDVRLNADRTAFHLSGTGNDDGLFVNSNANGVSFAAGMAREPGLWRAKNTSAELLDIQTSGLAFFMNTGLTVGNTFSPTVVFFVNSTTIGNASGAWNVDGIGGLNLQLNATTIMDIGVTSSTAATIKSGNLLTIANGSSLGVSSSNTGNLRYNSTTQHFEISENTGAYAKLNSSPVSASDVQLTTTSPTTIATFTPPAQGNYKVDIYYRVVTATTNVTITLTWTDGSGAQTSSIIPLTSTAIGSYIVPPTYVNSTASAITVTATSGTANNLYVSATITGA